MSNEMPDFREITSGLMFPEGPIAMPDGSVILVEIERGTLTRSVSESNTSITVGGGRLSYRR